jgi:hypothetical protein
VTDAREDGDARKAATVDDGAARRERECRASSSSSSPTENAASGDERSGTELRRSRGDR